MRAKRFGLVWRHRKKGFSIIEVITAVAILGIGIWAIVALFPTGQNIIRRSGLRQMATQLAHEAISDFLAEPAKMPFAIVPFDPADPQIVNRPVLLEPADLLRVRRTYNFVWGEPLDDGLPLGDPNKRIGLVWIDLNGNNNPEPRVDEWRAILRFAPATIYPSPLPLRNITNPPRVYREVFYSQLPDTDQTDRYNRPSVDFHYIVNADPAETVIGLPTQGNYPRLIRVTYEVGGQVISRRPFYVQNGIIDGLPNGTIVRKVMEEFPIDPSSFVFANGILTFNTQMPAPAGVLHEQLGFLRVDYFVAALNNPQLGDHWIVETGTTFDPDPTLKAQGVNSVFQTTFGGINSPPLVFSLMPPPQWGNPIGTGSGLFNVDAQSGLLAFSLPVGTRLRVAYRTGDDPNTPIDESWFLQVIKPPDDFQLLTQADSQVLSALPFEQLRWFTASNNPPPFSLQFYRLLAGLNVQVRYRSATNELFTEVVSISGDGFAKLSQVPSRIEEVRSASLLVRVSGGSMWRQSPPKTRADYVELITIVPPSQPVMP
jgi:prepilin-type N-terminal cleavage/methylation domain-containing protein